MTLATHGAAYRYPGRRTDSLPATTVRLEPGRVLALTGPSGAGKTTLARVLTGLLVPTGGSVTVDGRPLRRRRGALPGHTALLPQDPYAAADPTLTLGEAITTAARIAGRPVDPRAAAEGVGLDPALLERRPHQVSGGQLQRACLARALAQRPGYLVADEPTAHLDAAATAAVADVLTCAARAGMAVLAITHDTALAAAWADEVRPLTPPAPDAPGDPSPPRRPADALGDG